MAIYRSVFLQTVAFFLLATALSTLSLPAKAQPTPEQQPQQTTSPSSESPHSQQMIAEQFLDLVFVQNYAEAVTLLHPTLRRDWTPQVLQHDTEDFLKRTGPFVKRLHSRVDGNVVLVKTEFRKFTDEILVIFDDTGSQITGVDFPIHPARTIHLLQE